MGLCGSFRCGCGVTSTPAAAGAINGELPSIFVSGSGEPGDPYDLSLNDAWTAEVSALIGGPGEGGAWTSWTPTVTQSGSVTVTNTRSKYARYGRTIHWACLLDVTGTGTSANVIQVTIPVAAAGGGLVNVGQGYVLDSGTGYYVGAAITLAGGASVAIMRSNSALYVGADPAFALVSGDQINLSGTYEAAS